MKKKKNEEQKKEKQTEKQHNTTMPLCLLADATSPESASETPSNNHAYISIENLVVRR